MVDLKDGSNSAVRADRLDELFLRQNALMDRYRGLGMLPKYPLDLSQKEDVKVYRECVFHVIQELFETVVHLKNRPNRQTQVYDYDREGFEEEIIDSVHLMLELMILSGITPVKLMELYRAKNKKNHERIDSGY